MTPPTIQSAGREPEDIPRHIAIIMDGNGRWARSRGMPRHAGHRAGVRAARQIVETAGQRHVEYLTLFAFSSENWDRPNSEVNLLMNLFLEALQDEIEDLEENQVCLRFIGDLESLQPSLKDQIVAAETRTAANDGLKLVIAVAYGGRWDIVQATQRIAASVAAGKIEPREIDAALFDQTLALHGLPDPDLLIRTGGERRVSNFLLWNLAYSELLFVDVLWPDFGPAELDAALSFFASRQRRYGKTAAQADA